MGTSTSHELDDVSTAGLFRLAQSVDMMPDIGIDATLIKYSGTDSAAVLREYSNHLRILSTANGYVDKLGSTLISYSGAVNSVGLAALVISFMLDLAMRPAATDSGDTLNMLRRVFAEEKASDVRDSMHEYMKRLGMHLRDPVKALEDTERLEKQLSGQLTRLRNSMLHDNQMSSRSMKHWVNGAAFHSQMLVHAARLKTTSTNSDFDVYLNSVRAAVDMYRNDLRDLLNKYKDYKRSTILMDEPLRYSCVKYGCKDVKCEMKDDETKTSLNFLYYINFWEFTPNCYGLFTDYVNYMFTDWNQIKELNEYFTNLKDNTRELIKQHDTFNV
ncbi:uncharacterized protein LOC143521268 [Brachyhypopomus gauderio]|uniref:uncharacterized protein LOC143521268 n=1 Tax=Brachyhypopomus gauderio TaxID=698409 RepID=UPI0040433D57